MAQNIFSTEGPSLCCSDFTGKKHRVRFLYMSSNLGLTSSAGHRAEEFVESSLGSVC